jgi:gamma-glutamylcyclotransferase (GGCT)/AIG2-like uncharacterized protein YtfP
MIAALPYYETTSVSGFSVPCGGRMAIEVLPIFVYGTLRRGECRQGVWPRPPVRIEDACTCGTLYDLGVHPALLPGDGVPGDGVPGDRCVRGELWHIAAADLPETLRVLDEVEDYRGLDDDLYRRVVVACVDSRQEPCRAYAYVFARADRLMDCPVVPPGPDGCCRWRGQR